MIRELYLKNYAIFEVHRFEFFDGFTVVSGETGAGKSLVIGAISLLMGARADSESVRTGAKEAIVEGVFTLPTDSPAWAVVEEAGLDRDGDTLIVRRVVQATGGSKNYINSCSTTVSNLALVARYLIDLSGQHQHQFLLDEAQHLSVIDGEIFYNFV